MSNSNLIYKKMSEVMKSIGAVGKNQKNLVQGFKFRGIDDMINAIHGPLTEQGVFMTPRVVKYETDMREVVRSNGKSGVDKHVSMLVEFDFFAEDGSKVTAGPIAAEGLDSGDKATNKALSAALKYALIQTFSVPTEDMVDGDSTTPVIETKVAQTSVKSTPVTEVSTVSVKEIPVSVNNKETPPTPTLKRASNFRNNKLKQETVEQVQQKEDW